MPKSSPRNKEKTHQRIRMAIVRIEQGRPSIVDSSRKMSIAAVAEEAGVSRTLIINQYPDLLERVRGGSNKHIQKQRDDKHAALKKEREKNQGLRKELAALKQKLRLIVSKNATLELENRRFKDIIESENVRSLRANKQ